MKSHGKPAEKVKPKARDGPAHKAPGNCGTGAGGFKPGNSCGCPDCKGHADEPAGQHDPAVQRAHHRIARADRADHPHGDHVRAILAGKDKDGKVGRANPKAKEDADAIRSYEPARGTVAVGKLPGRPTESQAREVSGLARKQKRGDPLTDRELHRLADRDASHVGVRDGWDDSEKAGHRFLVHDRTTGRNEVASEADFAAMKPADRVRMRDAPHLVPLRQFDSQGVEVELHLGQYRRGLDPGYARRPADAYRQEPGQLARERKAFKGVKRAKFGTADPKS